MKKMKRLLLIANEPLSGQYSNGRTMMNMLQEYDKDSLAQLYIHGQPDREFCHNYFRVSDHDALNAFLHRKPGKEPGVQHSENKAAEQAGGKKIARNCLTMLLRDIVWSSEAWQSKEFEQFLTDFSPEVVLLQAGDLPYLFKLARQIAERFDVPLVMFNSESYVLKRYIYKEAVEMKFWHLLLKHRLKKQYAKLMERVSYCIYSIEQLEEDYQRAYPHAGKSTTLYTVSMLQGGREAEAPVQKEPFRVVYCGNLGVDRARPLAEFARILHEVDPTAVLEIYGRFAKPEEETLVCSLPGVKYCGVIPYDEVPGLLRSADLLLHCEYADRLEDLRMAFSTKIADSLAVGTPFLVYADRRYPFVKYLLKHDCAHVAGDLQELKEILEKCRYDEKYRNRYLANAQKVAAENHSADRNCGKFNRIVDET